MKKSKFIPPNPTTKDTAHKVVKGILSPVAGAGELFEYFISPPLEKRLDKWRENVGEALYLLEKNLGFKLEKLQHNEKFVTIVVQATRIAAQNHQQEKIDALRNAIISSALNPDVTDDLQMIYIRFIDELTPSHIVLLKFFVDFESEFVKLASYPAIFDFVHSRIEHAKTLTHDEFLILIGDLSMRGLVRISQYVSNFDDIFNPEPIYNEGDDSLPRILVTQIAKDFIRFISETDLFKVNTE